MTGESEDRNSGKVGGSTMKLVMYRLLDRAL